MHVSRRLWPLLALLLVASPVRAAGQGGDTLVQASDETRVQRLSASLMSPFCPGLTVASCPSPGAERIRQEIRRRLAAGESERAVVEALTREYGEALGGAPRARRWGLALWIPPAVMLLAGAGVLGYWLRHRALWSAAGAAQQQAAPVAPPADPALRQRLDEELRIFDREG